MPQIGETITYNATYTPSNATTPVTYAWSVNPSSAGIISSPNSASTNILWNEEGTHTINLNITNCGGTLSSSKTTLVSALTMYYTIERCDNGSTEKCEMNIPNLPLGTVIKSEGGICYFITGTTTEISTNIVESVESSCASCLGSPPVTCIPVNNFNYTINGVENADGFTLVGVQDVNIEVINYSPSNSTGPITYEYILTDFSSGIISSSTKTFPSVSVGSYILTIKIYNCTGSVTKTINFSVNSAPTPCTSVSSVSVSGEANVSTGQTVTYTAGYLPSNANVSSYQWSVDSSKGTINGSSSNSTVSVTWNNTGSTDVSLVIGSCGVFSPNYNYPVTISSTPTPCVPITEKSISAQNVIRAGDVVTFTAVAGPVNATTPISYSWVPASTSDTIIGSSTNSTVDVLIGSRSSYPDDQQFISCVMTNSCTAPWAHTYEFTVEEPCIEVTDTDYQVGPALNPTNMNINLGTTYSVDVNPIGSPTLPITFSIGIYDINNAFLYISSSSTPGTPLNYTFDDPAAKKLTINVGNCNNFIQKVVTLNVV